MLQIKSPEIYINEENAIKKTGEYIKDYGKKALVIWSKTSKEKVEKDLVKSLKQLQIESDVILFSGFPTLSKAKEYAKGAIDKECEVIIAVGGGRVQDVSKATGTFANLPVVAIPTIAATCASWAAVSIIYNDEGDFEQFLANKNSPKVVIVDSSIITEAPIRFLKAGIVDTMAKWYETVPGITGEKDGFSLQISVNGAKVAFDFLTKEGVHVIEKSENKIVDEDVIKTIDSIFYLAGFVGSFVGEKAYSGFAHPFYHASRRIKETHHRLHGEMVAFGLITQLVLEKKEEKVIANTIREFSKLDVAFTLDDLGLSENSKEKLTIIANRILDEFPGYTKFGFGTTVEEIVDGFYKADEFVKKYRIQEVDSYAS
jgi:glycerol dehydrogenase